VFEALQVYYVQRAKPRRRAYVRGLRLEIASTSRLPTFNDNVRGGSEYYQSASGKPNEDQSNFSALESEQ
jgi:hypothetical protein